VGESARDAAGRWRQGLTPLLWVGLTLFVLWLSGCGSSAALRGPVVLYTSVPSAAIVEIEAAFEKAYPEVDLQVYRASTGGVMARVDEELAAGTIGGDLIWVADGTVGEELKERGALLQHRPAEADALLPVLSDEDQYYFAARLLNMVVAYNTEAVAAPPSGYGDLLDRRYRGRVGHATPETSGAFLYFMGALLQDPAYGPTFFRQLSANEPAIQTNTQTTARIAAGELDVGITIDFTVRDLLRENPDAPIALVYPESGVVMVPSPVAIFKDASHPEAAKAFQRYILSQEGQAMLRDLVGVVPVRLDVAPPGDIQSITQLRVIPADPAWIRAHRDDVLSTFAALYEGR
jgi:iron(III) transport system substrate-binding protein